LLVIIAMTLFWWGRYAGQAEMEAVLDQPFAPDDIRRITTQLQLRGIKYKVQGDRILVAADRKSEALADLAYSQSLPRDTKAGFDEIIKNSSPWTPSSDRREQWNKYKEMTLAGIISEFPGVARAMVMIDQNQRSELAAGGGIQPSATVSLTMKTGTKPDSKLVNAAAELVSGAVASLSKNRIRVVADGISYAVAGDSPGGGGAWIDETRDAEMYFAQKLSGLLSFIDGAMVSVRVVPNRIQKKTTDHDPDPTRKIVAPLEEETLTEEGKTHSKAGEEGGVAPNVKMDLTSSGGGESNATSTEKTRSKNVVDYRLTKTEQIDPGGNGIITGASVFLPRSHFVRVYQKRNPSVSEPDDVAIQPLIDAELPAIRNSVKTCLGLDEKAISVAAYTDLMPTASAAPPAQAASSVTMLLGGHVKEIAIGALALISLIVVSLMVRKSSPAPAVAPSAQSRPPVALKQGDEPVGEAVEGGAMLDGMELDEDAVKTQQILDQVSSMVKDNPEAAANLVKRWLNRT
jgi:flagellar biosynthesis/type III secretory pathway M-ring protein FliF/YscJ